MSKTKIGEEQMPDEYYDLERRTEIKATSNRLVLQQVGQRKTLQKITKIMQIF